MSTNITFDSNDLQTASILTAEIQHSSIPTKDAKMYALAHANRSVIPFVSYPNRTIRVAGKLVAASITALDALEDTFKAYFRGKDKNIDIDYNSGTRRYIGTLNALSLDRPGGLQYANFEAEFLCTYPFGRNTSATTALTATGRTNSAYTDAHTFLGTAPYQLPLITISITTVTGGTGHVSFGNNANGQGITITGQTFVDGDVIEIDCEEKTVKLNDEEIDFLGAFPEFEPGNQTFSYSDGFTTRDFDITVTYYPMWL